MQNVITGGFWWWKQVTKSIISVAAAATDITGSNAVEYVTTKVIQLYIFCSKIYFFLAVLLLYFFGNILCKKIVRQQL